jgi:exodeoxyribonuclease VII small subunit
VTESSSPAPPPIDPEAPADIASLPFDKALDELKTVVARLEEGGLPLEESIALYERGAALHEHCGRLLDAAELRVQRLIDGAAGTGPRVMDLRPEDGEEL